MARRASARQRGAAHLQERGGGGRALTLAVAREGRSLCAVRRAGGEGGRAGGRATEQFDAAQLRAGECDEQVLSAAVARRERAAGAV